VASPPTTDIGAPDFWWGQVEPEWFENTYDLNFPESVVTYSRMRHDPQIKAVLNAYILPILRATWVIDPDGARDEVAEHVADDLGVNILGQDERPGAARRRGVIWQRHLRQALYEQLVFGFMPFERRYRIDDDGSAHLDALGARMPWTVARINTNRDGTISSLEQNIQFTPIPANRLVWYVNDLEGANWTGMSMLRACYGAWMLKHESWRVHATSIRRFGMGVPGVEAPPGATATQIAQAQQMASAMRAGDQAGMAVPAGFKPFLMGMTGGAPDALAFIQYLDRVIAKQALASLIELGQTETGSRALGDTFMDLFLLSLQAVADEAALVATSGQDGIPGIVVDIVDQNWGEDEPSPKLICTDVGTQYEATAAALQQLTATGALQPDASLDEWIRKQWHLPERTSPWIQPQPKQAPQPANPAAPAARGAEDGGAPATGTGNQGQGGSDTPGSGTPAAATAASRSTDQVQPRASGSVLRRQPTAIEAASGFDAEQHQQQWQTALDALMAAYQGVVAAQKTDIVDQVVACLEQGNVAQLATITADASGGVQVLLNAMINAWHAAVNAMIGEAASQGVQISAADVIMPALDQIAAGRVAFASTYMAQQGGSRAMRNVQPAKPAKDQATSAAEDVSAFLDDLSSRSLRDQLGGALTAAQNAGRVAVLKAAPASAGTATYTASEILDVNTCKKCQDEDGHQFESLAAAEEAYPTGGYINCQGDLRCRGTVVAIWGGNG
jgi:hypothetical protein